MKRKVLSILLALVLVLSFSLVTAVPVAAATPIYVNGATGLDTNDGETLGTAVATITKGIELVDVGGTVKVAAGTYNEGITLIDKELTIVGDPVSKPVITPTEDTGDQTWDIGPTGKGWFQVTGGPVKFENLVFDGTGQAIWIAVHFQVGGLGGIVKNCDFKNIQHSQYRGRGISNYDGYVEVLNSTFTNIERIGVFTGRKIPDSLTTVTLIRGCTYTGKGAGDWLDYGFETGAGAHATIEDNTVTACYGEDSGWKSAGIYVHETFGPGTSATITGNTISGSNYGIVVGYGDDTWPRSSQVVANYNNLTGNDSGVTSIGPQTPLVDATNNWWGHESGPTHASNPEGLGDAVSDDVLFTRWLTRAPTSVGFTTTIAQKIAISVSPISINFGSIVPGVDATGNDITVTNKGNVAIKLSTTLVNDTASFYTNYLYLSDTDAEIWIDSIENYDATTSVTPKLTGIPSDLTPDTYTVTLVFWAELP